MNGEGRKADRSYRPRVEALEALRLLDAGVSGALAPLFADRGLGLEAPPFPEASSSASPPASEAAWDAALLDARITDFLGEWGPSARAAEPEALLDGLGQLTRYLSRAWARAGIAPQQFEDCTQAVYETLLTNLGRDGFDHLAADVGRMGVRQVLNRESSDGPDFFRAIDMVKKRTQRERAFSSLDEHYAELSDQTGQDGASADWRSTLDEAIEETLSPREARLIRETLLGKTPAEIAQEWGMAPKTVSNEKTRALQKLREALLTSLESN